MSFGSDFIHYFRQGPSNIKDMTLFGAFVHHFRQLGRDHSAAAFSR
jgi:hypothetical protein